MKTVEEVRRLRLELLRTEFGTLVALNEKINLDKRDSTLSQILNSAKNSKTAKPKEMGSAMARKLERACSKEIGWMDTDPALLEKGFSQEAAEIAASIDSFTDPDQREWVLGMCRQATRVPRVGAGTQDPPIAQVGGV